MATGNIKRLAQTAFYQTHAFGSPWHKNLLKFSFGYTHTYKEAAAASDTAVHAAISGTIGATQTITSDITDPDVPRVLKVQPAGTAADNGNGIIEITGTNVEGKTITDSFKIVDGDQTEIEGTMAFRTVTSILIPGTDGTAATFSIGYTDKLGLNHRLFDQNTTVKVVYDATVGTIDSAVLDSAPTIGDSDEILVEKNYITPNTAPDGSKTFTMYYVFDSWSLGDINDNPEFLTTTSTSSTSSSSSTSTVTTSTSSTSTSSTSSSTSSTSSSTSSTSSSTSSTSTSTTTVP